MAGNSLSKFGRDMVRAVPDPLQGRILTDQIMADGDNQYHRLSVTSVLIEGVVVKALAGNAGDVYLTQIGADGLADGYPLDASESIALHIDDLDKVVIFISASGDGVAYAAISQDV